MVTPPEIELNGVLDEIDDERIIVVDDNVVDNSSKNITRAYKIGDDSPVHFMCYNHPFLKNDKITTWKLVKGDFKSYFFFLKFNFDE